MSRGGPDLRALIIADIRRLGKQTGKSPGIAAFAQETGIAEHEWRGVFWARWSEALAEAGLGANELQGKFDSDGVLAHYDVTF